MDRESVLALMSSSRDEAEWDNNEKLVNTVCGGLPAFWQKDVVDAKLKEDVLGPASGKKLHQRLVQWDYDHPDRVS